MLSLPNLESSYQLENAGISNHQGNMGSLRLSFFLLFGLFAFLGGFEFSKTTAATMESIDMFGHECAFSAAWTGPALSIKFTILAN
jgi:hypothetical protein